MSGAGSRSSTADSLQLLSSGQMRLIGLMPRASNFTFLAEVHDGDSGALAIYKPRDGEMPLWDFAQGTLCRREVAAYLLSESLGWPAIPPTVLRDGPQGEGSVQLLVDADPEEHFFTLRDADLDAFRPMAAFDVVANNADRKSGHCLLGRDGSIWAVDHGVTFSVEPKLRTVIWDFAGESLSRELKEDLRRVAGQLRSGPLKTALAGLLSPAEVLATARRAEALAAAGRFPHPSSPRPYPWPPV